MNDREFDALLESAGARSFRPDERRTDVTPWRRAIGNISAAAHVLHHAQLFLPELSAADHRRDPAAAWLPSAAAGERLVSRLLAARRAARGAVPALHRSQRDNLFQRRIRLLRGDGADLCHARGADAALLLLLAGITRNAEKGGDRRGRRPAAALLIWYAAVLTLAYVQYSGLLLGLAMLGCYILILRSLFRLSREMEESGYALTPAPVHLSDEMLVRAIAALLAVGIACGYLFFGSYRMDWQPKSDSLSAEAVEIRAQLLALGYPEDALNDLSEDDPARLPRRDARRSARGG